MLWATTRSGRSISVTTICVEPGVKPTAEAVIVTAWLPSDAPSVIVQAATLADVSPAGITIVGGSVNLPVSLDTRITFNSASVGVFRLTVIVAAGSSPSATNCRSTTRLNVGPSSSSTSKGAVACSRYGDALQQPLQDETTAEAVIVTGRVPSTNPLSIAAI